MSLRTFLLLVPVGVVAAFLALSCDPELTYYTLTVESNDTTRGTVSISPEADSYASGSTVTVTATAASGYGFSVWAGASDATTASITLTVDSDMNLEAIFTKAASTTILVYLDADNSLDTYGLANLNQMEAVDLADSGVNVLVLYDSASSGDSALYLVGHDSMGANNSTIVSTRLSCSALGINSTLGASEVDMADPATLRAFVAWGKAAFPATHTALVLWDHGSGWRSLDTGFASSLVSGSKALESDDTSGTIMTTSQLGSALDDGGLDILVFDLCYGGMIEPAYELRNKASYMVASEETVPGAGIPYDAWLGSYIATDKSLASFYTTLIDEYDSNYSLVPGVTMAAYDLSRTDELMTALNAFSSAVADNITSVSRQSAVKAVLFNNTEDYYTSGSDIGIDIYDMAAKMLAGFSTSSYAASEAAALETAVDNMVLYEKHSLLSSSTYNEENKDSHGIAIHLTLCYPRSVAFPAYESFAYFADHADLDTAFVTSGSSAAAYFYNWDWTTSDYKRHNPTVNVPAFVDATGNTWVPNFTGQSGLLYKVFYQSF